MPVQLPITTDPDGSDLTAEVEDTDNNISIDLEGALPNFTGWWDGTRIYVQRGFPAVINGFCAVLENQNVGGTSGAKGASISCDADGTNVVLTLVGADDSQTVIDLSVAQLNLSSTGSGLFAGFNFPDTVDPDTGNVLAP
jgi:hypothetical protein